MGGLSVEREVSLRSGEKCFEALCSLGYDVVKIDAVRDLTWRLAEEEVEVAFLALHGRFGEDGTVQGLLEFMDVPYTGSGVLASALGMHKVCAKKIVRQTGVPTPDYLELTPDRSAAQLAAEGAELLGLPVMLKPVKEGSSLGVVKCNDVAGLTTAIEQGRREFGEIFLEVYVAGTEITVGVVERDGVPLALPILELVPHNEFYDYEAKYTHGMTDFIIPARLQPEVYIEAQRLSVLAHEAIGCRGYSRIDFMVADGVPYFTEINTLPGMTDLSDLPAQAAAAGIPYPELVEMILLTAGDCGC
jgi:D-alanine-D-alanine ligase